MERATDWICLWRERVDAQSQSWKGHGQNADGLGDGWRTRARGFHANLKHRWAQPDSSRTFVVDWSQAHHDATVLDIGAGTGAWLIGTGSVSGRPGRAPRWCTRRPKGKDGC